LLDTNPEALKQKWLEFFNGYGYGNSITINADQFPDSRAIHVNYDDLNIFDTELMNYLLEYPKRAIKAGEEAICDLVPPESNVPLSIRLINVPEKTMINIREIRAKHMGKMVTIRGLVKKVTAVRPETIFARYECLRCRSQFDEEQDSMVMAPPLECDKDRGGCGRSASSTKFKFIPETSVYMDSQKFHIQELPESSPDGPPQSIPVKIINDLAGIIYPGRTATITGIIKPKIKSNTGQINTLLDIYIEVNNIIVEDTTYSDIEITEEDELEIKEFAEIGNPFEKVVNALAPTIFGHHIIKQAIALQLFGGIRKLMPDKVRVRGDSHLLLMGDPGVAKSQLLRYTAEISPRAKAGSGKTASGVGLTASVVKDDDGNWVAEAGLVVLADNGLAVIDEFDKMSKEDRSAIHTAMEQQIVELNKADIHITLPSRCAILAAANPKLGRFEDYTSITEQINLSPTLLSRFDLIFIMRDIPKSQADSDIANHILNAHSNWDNPESPSKPQYPVEFIQKYIAYAKRLNPHLTPEASELIHQYYIGIRQQSYAQDQAEQHPIGITARQLEALVRLSESSARSRLSKSVDIADAERAIRIYAEFLSAIIQTEGGLDIDVISTGIPKSQRQRIELLYKVIRTIIENSEDKHGALETDIFAEMDNHGFDEHTTTIDINRLSDKGELWFSGQGKNRKIHFA